MADAVTTEILMDGARNAVVRLNGVSDGTGETAVVKVDPASFMPVPSGFIVEKIDYDLSNMQVSLYFEATQNELIYTVSGGQDSKDFTDIGGLGPTNFGATGRILLTTRSAGNADTYSIVLKLRKKFL